MNISLEAFGSLVSSSSSDFWNICQYTSLGGGLQSNQKGQILVLHNLWQLHRGFMVEIKPEFCKDLGKHAMFAKSNRRTAACLSIPLYFTSCYLHVLFINPLIDQIIINLFLQPFILCLPYAKYHTRSWAHSSAKERHSPFPRSA